ncbi:unnamed protein product [Psylliodes chrysocephalus]|uniref:Uncharacterized protein n=1 Tax=Psylliodes chrysocephalus TaxID=3402493 RepID=A0A9P0D0Z1_9CUCU|nr:unnamed protein product [Psylliodes chrysocephala]
MFKGFEKKKPSPGLNDCGVSKSLIKHGISLVMLNPDVLRVGRPVDPQKAASVANLLSKHYEWRELPNLKFYKEVNDQDPVHPLQMIPEDVNDVVCCQNNDGLGTGIDLRI